VVSSSATHALNLFGAARSPVSLLALSWDVVAPSPVLKSLVAPVVIASSHAVTLFPLACAAAVASRLKLLQ